VKKYWNGDLQARMMFLLRIPRDIATGLFIEAALIGRLKSHCGRCGGIAFLRDFQVRDTGVEILRFGFVAFQFDFQPQFVY